MYKLKPIFLAFTFLGCADSVANGMSHPNIKIDTKFLEKCRDTIALFDSNTDKIKQSESVVINCLAYSEVETKALAEANRNTKISGSNFIFDYQNCALIMDNFYYENSVKASLGGYLIDLSNVDVSLNDGGIYGTILTLECKGKVDCVGLVEENRRTDRLSMTLTDKSVYAEQIKEALDKIPFHCANLR